MKSTKKPIYNHRLAQKSKDDWETNFVSKLDAPEKSNEDVANNLLYLAATKLFGARKSNYDEFGGSQKLIKYLKDDTIIKLRELAKYNENTQAVYDVLFGRLLGD